MRFSAQNSIVILSTTILLGGCCSGPKCWETQTGGDWPRTRAKPIKKFGKVINNSVSSPNKDRTDWRYIQVKRRGTLKVDLHWDKGRNKLQLTIFDNMGVKLMDGRVWGTGGRKAVVAVERPGRYYIRVRAKGEDDASAYALKVTFKGGIVKVCHGCEVGKKKCVGKEHYIICEQTSPGCTIWPKVHSCAEGDCSTLSCGSTVADPPPRHPRRGCRPGSRRCLGKARFVTCVAKRGGKRGWGKPANCPGGKTCQRGGVCKKKEVKVVKTIKKSGCVYGKIRTMYRYRGRMNLQIHIGSNTGIRPGHTGYVLDGTTNSPLPNGAIRVTRVPGTHCIAVTQMETIGKNRRVCIKVPK